MYMLWFNFILGFIFVIVVIVFFGMIVYDNDFWKQKAGSTIKPRRF